MSDPSAWASFVPVPGTSVSETEIDGELVLLNTSTGALHVLNPVAAAIWSELDGARPVEQIVAELSEAAGADRARVRQDVIRYLDELGEKGLLSRTPPSG